MGEFPKVRNWFLSLLCAWTHGAMVRFHANEQGARKAKVESNQPLQSRAVDTEDTAVCSVRLVKIQVSESSQNLVTQNCDEAQAYPQFTVSSRTEKHYFKV